MLTQKRDDKNKLYSLHAPEVECIAKGKNHKKYEFGSKVSVATTSRSNFIVGIQSLDRNQYDAIPVLSQRSSPKAKMMLGRLFYYPPEIPKVIYTTNAIESLNMTVRKVIKNKRALPSEDSMLKLVYLALKNIEKRTMPIRDWGLGIGDWGLAANRFSIEFGDRFTQ